MGILLVSTQIYPPRKPKPHKLFTPYNFSTPGKIQKEASQPTGVYKEELGVCLWRRRLDVDLKASGGRSAGDYTYIHTYIHTYIIYIYIYIHTVLISVHTHTVLGGWHLGLLLSGCAEQRTSKLPKNNSTLSTRPYNPKLQTLKRATLNPQTENPKP